MHLFRTLCFTLALAAAAPMVSAEGVLFLPAPDAGEDPLTVGSVAVVADAFATTGELVLPWRQALYLQERAPSLAAATRSVEASRVVQLAWHGGRGDRTLTVTELGDTGRQQSAFQTTPAQVLAALAEAVGKLTELLDAGRASPPRWPPTKSEAAFAAFCEGATDLAQPGGARDAEPKLLEAVRLDDAFAQAWHELGVARWLLDRREEAVAAYRQALAARPDSPMTRNNLALALIRLEREDEAEVELGMALTGADPVAVAFAHVTQGTAHRLRGDLAAATAEYQQAQALLPKHPAPVLNLALVARKRRDSAECERLLRRVVALDTDRFATADAYRLLGNLALGRRNYAQAATEYELAVEARPDYADVYCALSVAYRNLRQYAEAEAACRRALDLTDRSTTLAMAENNLGRVFEARGDKAQAAVHYRLALQHNPDSATIQTNLKRVE